MIRLSDNDSMRRDTGYDVGVEAQLILGLMMMAVFAALVCLIFTEL